MTGKVTLTVLIGVMNIHWRYETVGLSTEPTRSEGTLAQKDGAALLA